VSLAPRWHRPRAAVSLTARTRSVTCDKPVNPHATITAATGADYSVSEPTGLSG